MSQATLNEVLDNCCQLLAQGQVSDGMGLLLAKIGEVRSSQTRADWAETCKRIQAHPVCAQIHQDPIISRGFTRPRGYVGDAVTLDYHYQCWDGLLDGLTPLGMQLLQYDIQHPSSLAIRARRDLVAAAIDQVAERVPDARVLSVASGHAREAQHSRAVQERRLGNLVALDQDRLSLDKVAELYAGLPVTSQHARIKDLLAGRLELGKFDLIYSQGLFDYLEQPVAKALTNTLFAMLRPGGRIIIGNFLEQWSIAAYSESFGNWWLVLRTRESLADLVSDIAPARLAETRVWIDEWQEIGYVEATASA